MTRDKDLDALGGHRGSQKLLSDLEATRRRNDCRHQYRAYADSTGGGKWYRLKPRKEKGAGREKS